MTFTNKQLAALKLPLDIDKKCYFFPPEAGKELANKPYMPAHVSVETANEIFDFNWRSELVDFGLLFEFEEQKTNRDKTKSWMAYTACYWAKVRVILGGEDGSAVFHTAIGICTGDQQRSRGAAHEIALMGAESVAKKRALYNLGPQFGGSLKDPLDKAGIETAMRMAAESDGVPVQAASAPPLPAQASKVDGPKPAAPNQAEAVVEAVKEFKSRTGRLPKIAEERNLRTPSKFRALTPKQLGEVLQAIAAEEGVN